MSKFLEWLRKGVLIGDGAMGTLLLQEMKRFSCPEEANLTHPDLVLGIHLRYIAAGAHIIETNTFAANSPKLREHGLEERMEEINSKAVKLAREAREISGKEVLIAGSIGPLGVFGRLTSESQINSRQEYRRQAAILEQRGAELFVLETFSSSEELRTAVEAVHSISSLPIVAQLTFPGGELRTREDGGIGERFAEIVDLPIAALGVNCGAGPRELLEALEAIPRSKKYVISISPNAGLPVRSGGRYVYPDSTPDYFADFARDAAQLGARIIGGCCGTRPEHIQAMAEALKDIVVPDRVPVSATVAQPAPPRAVEQELPSRLARKFDEGKFVVSIQIDPPKGSETQRLLDAIAAFKESGVVDLIDVNSNPLGRLHMDSLWISVQVERSGLESLPHITPRDASVMGLQGNLLGAHSEGIRNLLVITGDPSIVGGSAGGKDVYQTDNASGALKLVGESYPFGPGGLFLLTFDNHNSVNGIREFAKAKGAQVVYTPVLPPDLLVDDARLAAHLARGKRGHCLFAYPAQSNFSGVQHSLEWIDRAQAFGWDVLLDAAAFVPTNRLDLSRWRPDFVSISFYKIFGYPTGVGCLLARKAALKKLLRPWFSGGTITVASVQAGRYYLQEGPEAFEDGTLNYLALPAVEGGLKHIETIGIAKIHLRVKCLCGWLIGELQQLAHSNGNPLVRIYGPVDTRSRGGTVTMNFYDLQGRFVDHELVERRAGEHRISLRTGCFCNPGDGELALEISADELTACFVHSKERLSRDDFRRCIDAKSTGAVRVSMGLVTSVQLFEPTVSASCSCQFSNGSFW